MKNNIKKQPHTIIRIKEGDGNLFDYFSRNARFEGGEYLIEKDGIVLIDKSPKALFEKLKNLK